MADEQVTIDVDMTGDEAALSALRRIDNRLVGLEGSTNQVAGEVRKTRSSMMGMAQTLTRAAAVAGSLAAAFHTVKRATGAVVGAMKEGVQTAAEFRFEISKAAARTDATTQTLREFARTAQRASATSAFGSQEASQGLTELAKAGFSAKQSQEALRGVLRQAAAGQTDVAEAASTATGVLKSFRIETENMARVNNNLVKAATTSKTTINELGDALGVVGSAARQAGLSMEQTTAFIAKMQDKNLSASRASIALRRAIAVLSDPTSTAHNEMEAMGIELDKTASTGEQLFSVLQQLEGAGNKVGKMAQILGVRAGPTLQAALTQGVGSIREYAQELRSAGGVAKEIEQFQLQNLQGQLEIIKGTANSLVTNAFSPLSQALGRQAAKWADWLNQLLRNEKLMGRIQQSVGRVATRMGELLQALAPMAKGTAELAVILHGGLGGALVAVGMAIERVRGAIVTLERTIAGDFQGAMEASRRSAKRAGKMFQAWHESGMAMTRATEEVAPAMNEAGESLEKAGREATKSAKAMRQQRTQIQKATKDARELKNAFKKLNKEMTDDAVRSAMQKKGEALLKLGKNLKNFEDKTAGAAFPAGGEIDITQFKSARNAIRNMRSSMESLNQVDFMETGLRDTRAFEERISGLDQGMKDMLKGMRREATTAQKKMRRLMQKLASGDLGPNEAASTIRQFRKEYKVAADNVAALTQNLKGAEKQSNKTSLNPPGDGGDGDKGKDEEETKLKAGKGDPKDRIPLDILRQRKKVTKATSKIERARRKQKLKFMKLEDKQRKNNISGQRAALQAANLFEKSQQEINKLIDERNRKIRQANQAIELQKNLAQQRLDVENATSKKGRARQKAALRRMKIRSKFDKKARKAERELKGLVSDKALAQKKANLKKKEKLALLESEEKKEKAINQIISQRLQRISRGAQGAVSTDVMSDQFAKPEQVGGKFQKTNERLEAANRKFEKLKQSKRDAQLQGASDQEVAKIKAKIENKRKFIRLLKQEKQERKEILRQSKKEIQAMRQQAQSFGKAAGQATQGFDNFRKNSEAIGNVMEGAFAGKGKKNIENFDKAMGGLQSGLSSVGGAAQSAMKAMEAGTKARAITAGIFSTAKSIAYGAEAIMGNPAAAAASAAHGLAAAKYFSIAGKAGGAQSAAASGGGSVPKQGDVQKTNPEKVGKAIAEGMEEENRGQVNVYDFSGATMLEGAPAIQNEINTATQKAKNRQIKRERLDQGGG